MRAASRCPPPPSPGLGLWWWGVSTPTPTPLPCLSLPLSCLPICHGWRTRLGCHFRETAKTHAENQLCDLLSRRTSHRLPCLDVCLRWCLLFSVLLACVWLLVTRKAYADSTMDGETDISVMSASDLTSIGFDSTVDTDNVLETPQRAPHELAGRARLSTDFASECARRSIESQVGGGGAGGAGSGAKGDVEAMLAEMLSAPVLRGLRLLLDLICKEGAGRGSQAGTAEHSRLLASCNDMAMLALKRDVLSRASALRALIAKLPGMVSRREWTAVVAELSRHGRHGVELRALRKEFENVLVGLRVAPLFEVERVLHSDFSRALLVTDMAVEAQLEALLRRSPLPRSELEELVLVVGQLHAMRSAHEAVDIGGIHAHPENLYSMPGSADVTPGGTGWAAELGRRVAVALAGQGAWLPVLSWQLAGEDSHGKGQARAMFGDVSVRSAEVVHCQSCFLAYVASVRAQVRFALNPKPYTLRDEKAGRRRASAVEWRELKQNCYELLCCYARASPPAWRQWWAGCFLERVDGGWSRAACRHPSGCTRAREPNQTCGAQVVEEGVRRAAGSSGLGLDVLTRASPFFRHMRSLIEEEGVWLPSGSGPASDDNADMDISPLAKAATTRGGGATEPTGKACHQSSGLAALPRFGHRLALTPLMAAHPPAHSCGRDGKRRRAEFSVSGLGESCGPLTARGVSALDPSLRSVSTRDEGFPCCAPRRMHLALVIVKASGMPCTKHASLPGAHSFLCVADAVRSVTPSVP